MTQNSVCLSRRRFIVMAAGLGAVLAAGANMYQAPEVALADGKPKVGIAASDDPTMVIDAVGNEFVIPEKTERIGITCWGGATHEALIFAGPERIVVEPTQEFGQLLRMYPELNDIPDGGSFDDVNPETIAAAEPDIVLGGFHASKGNEQLREIGLPVYTMLIGWAAKDTLKQEFLNVSRVLGNPEKGEELVKYWDDTFKVIDEHIAKLPEDLRKRTVYYCGGPNITKANRGDWGRAWIDGIGATFAVPESDLEGDVTPEKVLLWDPDVIILKGEPKAFLEDPALQEMKAVKSGDVYTLPVGSFWWDRPSPEAPLGFIWLAQKVFPGYFDDIDLEAETVAFYKKFFNYDLPHEEYENFFIFGATSVK